MTALPELMIVRATVAAGPYAASELISVAFLDDGTGRLVAHDDGTRTRAAAYGVRALPEIFTATVVHGAGALRRGEDIVLSFVDAGLARIHRMTATSAVPPVSAPAIAVAAPIDVARVSPAATVASHGVRVRLTWDEARARRFANVTDKLFAVDRLGWYRHVLATRLLLPTAVDCADAAGTLEATRRLETLIAATSATLGRPLLTALMPSFAVTHDWLETIDTPEISRALAGLRATIGSHARDETALGDDELGPATFVTCLRGADLEGDSGASADAFLPLLIAAHSSDRRLSDCLTAYRTSLADMFGQTARSADAVRLGRMVEPNRVLDERLADVALTLRETFCNGAVA